jgi:hypothetical protein
VFREKPIIATLHEAFQYLMSTKPDILALGNCLLRKKIKSFCCMPTIGIAFNRIELGLFAMKRTKTQSICSGLTP